MKLKQLINLKVVHQSHPLRHEVEQYVASRYKLAFNADITEFMPQFLCIYSHHKLLSVCGYRVASQAPLFLEQYLPETAEAMMAK